MYKVFFTILLLMFFQMNIFGQEKNVASTPLENLSTDGITGDIKDRIAVLIGEKDFVLLENDNGAFSGEAVFYFLRHKSLDHWSRTCVFYRDKIYLEKDFEKFLKDYDFLKKSETLQLFTDAYRQFYLNNSAIHQGFIVDGNYLEKYSESLKSYEKGFNKLAFRKIHQPNLEKNSVGDVRIKFYVDYPTAEKIQKNKFTISSNYKFAHKEKIFHQEKNVTIN